MLLNDKYEIFSNEEQIQKLVRWLHICRHTYDCALLDKSNAYLCYRLNYFTHPKYKFDYWFPTDKVVELIKRKFRKEEYTMFLLGNFQVWLNNIYKKEKWSNNVAFADSNFLLEELGEVAEIINDGNLKNQREKIIEEIGDVISAVVAISNRYSLVINEDCLENHTISVTELILKILDYSGKIAREVRRREIGRHVHKEVMSLEEMDLKLSDYINVVLSFLISLLQIFSYELDEVLTYHMKKLEDKYK